MFTRFEKRYSLFLYDLYSIYGVIILKNHKRTIDYKMITKNNTVNMKGIAIILVIVGHLVTSKDLSWPFELRYFASFGVSIFLVISGYGLTKSYLNHGLDCFFQKRFKAVYFPFVVSTLLLSAFTLVIFSNPLSILRTLTFTNPALTFDGTMWYIYAIALWYVFFFIAFKFLNKYIALSLLFAISIFYLSYDPFKSFENLSFQTKLHAFTFPVGVMIALFENWFEKYKEILFITLSCLFLITLCLLWKGYDFYLFSLCGAMLALSMFFAFSIYNINIKTIEVFGIYSYELYLLEGVFRRYRLSSDEIINLAAMIILLLSLSVSLRKVINRLP